MIKVYPRGQIAKIHLHFHIKCSLNSIQLPIAPPSPLTHATGSVWLKN